MTGHTGIELRYQSILRNLPYTEDRNGVACLLAFRADDHPGAAFRRAAVSGFSARTVAAVARVHVARPAFERIFLGGSGGSIHGRSAHRLCRGVLCSGEPVWRLGAAGTEFR